MSSFFSTEQIANVVRILTRIILPRLPNIHMLNHLRGGGDHRLRRSRIHVNEGRPEEDKWDAEEREVQAASEELLQICPQESYGSDWE